MDLDDYRERSRALRRIDNRISAKLEARFGPGWTDVPQTEYNKVLMETEKHWEVLRYYYEAALVNSGDIITYVPLVYVMLLRAKQQIANLMVGQGYPTCIMRKNDAFMR